MAGEPQQKRRRLPFKPPSRTSSSGPSAGSSTAAQDKGKAREPTAQPTSSKQPSAPTEASMPKAQSKTQTSTSKNTPGKRSREDYINALPATPSDLASDSDSEISGRDVERPISEEPDYILAEITHRTPQENIALGTPQINPKLMTSIFHHFLKNDKTRISKDADAMMAKYMDLFVREAIARGKLERDLVNESKGRSGPGDNFIEVEDLETLAPWLIMDF